MEESSDTGLIALGIEEKITKNEKESKTSPI